MNPAQSPEFAVGVDVGRETGIAYVRADVVAGRVQLPLVLVGCARIYGEPRPWCRRIDDFASSISTPPDHCWIEKPPPVSRGDTLAGDSRGQKSWFGMGRYAGRAEGALLRAGWAALFVEQSLWARVLSPLGVARKKKGEGRHRFSECARLLRIEGGDPVASSHLVDSVDVAEGALIAAAALICRGTPPAVKRAKRGAAKRKARTLSAARSVLNRAA